MDPAFGKMLLWCCPPHSIAYIILISWIYRNVMALLIILMVLEWAFFFDAEKNTNKFISISIYNTNSPLFYEELPWDIAVLLQASPAALTILLYKGFELNVFYPIANLPCWKDQHMWCFRCWCAVYLFRLHKG